MTTDSIKELVTYLRALRLNICNAAADALEAMAGEVEWLTKHHNDYRKITRKAIDALRARAEAAEAERDRLAGEVETAKSQFKALQMVTSKEHEDTKAERDRLKAVGQKLLAKFDHPTASVTQWDVDELHKALGGDE